MRNLFLYLFLIISLIGCSQEVEEVQGNGQKEDNQSEKIVESNDETEDTEVVEEQSEEEEVTAIPADSYKHYRPEVGVEKKFYENDLHVMTELVIAENEEYIQRVIYLGDAPTVQVLRWTDDEVSVVYEDSEIEDPTVNILDEFESLAKTHTNEHSNVGDVLLGQSPTWKLTESSASIEVPFGKFEKVFVISKTTKEVEDADTIYTYYLAPGLGLIKESYEVTGEQGFYAEAVLKEVEK
jgi:hypothetical protein